MTPAHTPQVAFQQADYVAWNVWAAMNDRALLPFRYQHLGSMLALGATNAAVALPVPVPLPLQTTVQSSPLGGCCFAGVLRFLVPDGASSLGWCSVVGVLGAGGHHHQPDLRSPGQGRRDLGCWGLGDHTQQQYHAG